MRRKGGEDEGRAIQRGHGVAQPSPFPPPFLTEFWAQCHLRRLPTAARCMPCPLQGAWPPRRPRIRRQLRTEGRGGRGEVERADRSSGPHARVPSMRTHSPHAPHQQARRPRALWRMHGASGSTAWRQQTAGYCCCCCLVGGLTDDVVVLRLQRRLVVHLVALANKEPPQRAQHDGDKPVKQQCHRCCGV